MKFKVFTELHSVMRGRASVSPPALLDTSATGFRSLKERSSTSTSRTAKPVALEETLVAAEDPQGTESVAVGPVAVPEQVEQEKTADVPGPSGISGSGSSELSRKDAGEPRKKKRKPNKFERVEKSMQKTIDSFLASEGKKGVHRVREKEDGDGDGE